MAEHHSSAIIVRPADALPSPGLSLHELWKPYVYKGIGFDIFDPWGEIWGSDDDDA
jgi:hypothetical protein